MKEVNRILLALLKPDDFKFAAADSGCSTASPGAGIGRDIQPGNRLDLIHRLSRFIHDSAFDRFSRLKRNANLKRFGIGFRADFLDGVGIVPQATGLASAEFPAADLLQYEIAAALLD